VDREFVAYGARSTKSHETNEKQLREKEDGTATITLAASCSCQLLLPPAHWLAPSSTELSCFATPEYGATVYLQGYFYPLLCLTSQKRHGISLAHCRLDKEQNNHKEQAMPIDEQETRRNTVVTETPAARHEVTQTRREYTAEPKGTSNAAVAVLVILAIAVLGLLGLLFWSMQANSNNDNLAAQQQTPPTSQQPVIVQQFTHPAAAHHCQPAAAPVGELQRLKR
jgi:hypothetical protein